MDYCLDILINDFSPHQFTQPPQVDTAWGPAIHAMDEGKLFWRDDLWIHPAPAPQFLVKRLPISWQEEPWTYLSIGGELLLDLEGEANAEGRGKDAMAVLRAMLHALLDNQQRWAVFHSYQCEDLNAEYRLSVDELCDKIILSYRDDAQPPRGFYALSALEATRWI